MLLVKMTLSHRFPGLPRLLVPLTVSNIMCFGRRVMVVIEHSAQLPNELMITG